MKTEREILLEKKLNDFGFYLNEEVDYLTVNDKVAMRCFKGHFIINTLNGIFRYKKCMRCEVLKTYKDTCSIIESYGYKVISEEESYTDLYSDIEYVCDRNHKQSHNRSYFKRGHKCSECFKLKTYYKVVDELKEDGYTILTSEFEYENAKTKVEYICNLGHNHSTKVSDLSKGNRCGKCKGEKLSKIKRKPINEVLEIFKSENYKILKGINKYRNSSSVFTVECINGHSYETSISNFQSGYRCKRCAYDNNSGEFNYNWKGGITPLHNHIRNSILRWKLDSFDNHNKTCFISNIKESNRTKLVVHHHKNFSDILQETLDELNLTVKEVINEYSDDELEMIENICLKKHYEYGLGIVMTEDIHILFHKVYGTRNNNYEQVLEFKIDYNEGKYNDVKGT